MIGDEAKLNQKVTKVDGVVRETYQTPDGKNVEEVTTVNWNEKSHMDREEQKYPAGDIVALEGNDRDTPVNDEMALRTVGGTANAADNMGNTEGLENRNTKEAAPGTVPRLGIQGQLDPMKRMHMKDVNAPKKIRIGGQDLDILVPNNMDVKQFSGV